MTKILLSTAGSGGDLFPLIPIANRLGELGHEVLFSVPRVLGLYLRSVGLAAHASKPGPDSAPLVSDFPMTNRFFGWSSLRDAYVHLAAPRLDAETRQLRHLIQTWQPEVVVTLNEASSRIAALTEGVPHIQFSTFPNLFRLAKPTQFALAFQRAVRAATPPAVIDQFGFAYIAWGLDASTVLLHDPVLIDPDCVPATTPPIGFPYWDELPVGTADTERAMHWAAADNKPIVVATLGSFMGIRPNETWSSVVKASRECGARVIVANARNVALEQAIANDPETLIIGFTPLSDVLPLAAAVVHHGGIGTTFAALHSACPSVVLPQAFDQCHVGASLERAGLGVCAANTGVKAALDFALHDSTMRAATSIAAQRLVPPEVAAQRASETILAAVSV